MLCAHFSMRGLHVHMKASCAQISRTQLLWIVVCLLLHKLASAQGKVAAAAIAALASVLRELPGDVRKGKVLPALRGYWPPRTTSLGPEVQLALAERLAALLDGLQGCMDGEDDPLAVAACFKCGFTVQNAAELQQTHKQSSLITCQGVSINLYRQPAGLEAILCADYTSRCLDKILPWL